MYDSHAEVPIQLLFEDLMNATTTAINVLTSPKFLSKKIIDMKRLKSIFHHIYANDFLNFNNLNSLLSLRTEEDSKTY